MKILVVTGSSGGHIFPALSFLERIRQAHKDSSVLLVMPKQSVLRETLRQQYDVAYICISPITLKVSLKNFFGLLRFFKGCIESVGIVAKFRPDIIVGFGSISSIPLLLCGCSLGIKTLVHEQNVIPGRANRILFRFVDKVAISFKESNAYLARLKRKVVLTGNPIRQSLQRCQKERALDFFGLRSGFCTALVMGGSQGSQAVNAAFVKAISQISCKERVQVIHLCGAADYAFLEESYKKSKIQARLFAFLKEMQYAYSAADFVISRAGATSIAELIYFRLPALLIPYPYAYTHQNENAKVLEKIGSAVIIQEDRVEPEVLAHTLEQFISEASQMKAMRSGYDRMATLNASQELVQLALSLAQKT